MNSSEHAFVASAMPVGNLRFKDLTGKRFGRLVAEAYGGRGENGRQIWMFLCDCGTKVVRIAKTVLAGRARSCGCLDRENYENAIKRLPSMSANNRIHGMAHTIEYRTWEQAKKRCHGIGSDTRDLYKNWGGRGIVMCDEWRNSFEAFFAFMGPRPSPRHSIDRFPNNDGNYEPGNVRWATASQQRRNQRSNFMLTANGETRCLTEWAERIGVSPETLFGRKKRLGWNDEDTINKPVQKRRFL